MRLKGSMVDRLPPDKREKMERTLRRMEEVRRNDEMRLRNIIEAKKEWAINERKTGFDVIDQLDGQIEQIKNELEVQIQELKEQNDLRIQEVKERQERVNIQIIKLDGVLLALNDLIAESAKQEEEMKKQREAEARQAASEAKKKAEEETAKKIAEEEVAAKAAEEEAIKKAEEEKAAKKAMAAAKRREKREMKKAEDKKLGKETKRKSTTSKAKTSITKKK